MFPRSSARIRGAVIDNEQDRHAAFQERMFEYAFNVERRFALQNALWATRREASSKSVTRYALRRRRKLADRQPDNRVELLGLTPRREQRTAS